MNILYHHRTQGKGVEGVHIEEFKNGLISLGNSVDTISPLGLNRGGQGAAVRQSPVKRIFAFVSKAMPEICFEFLEILYNFAAARYFERQLKERKYDLIYERYAIFNWAGVAAARRNKTPIILEINYTSYTPLYRRRSRLLLPFAHWIDKKLFLKADGFAVVSNYLKEQLISLGVRPERIVVTTNAADPERFIPSIHGEEVRKKYGIENKKVIGFIGGFYPWHGLDLLLEAFIMIRKEIKDAVLLLGGDGPLKGSLENRIKELNLESAVVFTGKIDHAKLPEYIAAFDVAVMPDSNDYGSPMKIFEYMAMGKPVVAPRLGPLEDGMDNGSEGFLFKQGNKEELNKSLITLLRDAELRTRMARQAREHVVQKHTWQKNAESVLSLHQELISGREQ